MKTPRRRQAPKQDSVTERAMTAWYERAVQHPQPGQFPKYDERRPPAFVSLPPTARKTAKRQRK